MPNKVLMHGYEAIGRGAILAGCKHYYGYPITPQTEIGEYMARYLPGCGGVFLQTESELGAINMVFGAACTGQRVMTSTAGPGFALMIEGISNIAGAEIPAVLVLCSRGGPGPGNLDPTQLDYVAAVKGGPGGYHSIVLAPDSVQEQFDLTQVAFDLADMYRIMVIVFIDGALSHMMEPLEERQIRAYTDAELPPKSWALTGKKGRKRIVMKSSLVDNNQYFAFHFQKYQELAAPDSKEIRYETIATDDAEIIVVAFGFVSRMARGAVEKMRQEGIKVGMIRPITLWPFPSKVINAAASGSRKFLVIEGNMGQMLEDVERAVAGKSQVYFLGQPNNFISVDEISGRIESIIKGDG